MSGTTDPVSAPTDNAEWARQTDQRINSLENASSVRVGAWVLSTSEDGNLIASNSNGGTRVLAVKPPDGENDPDAIESAETPSVCATRVTDFAVPASPGGVVRFDGASSESGGDWTGGKKDFDSILVPVAGSYWVDATVHSTSNSNSKFVAVIRVNGVGMAAGAFSALGTSVGGSTAFGGGSGSHSHGAGSLNVNASTTGMSARAGRLLELNAGDSIELYVVNTSGSTFNIGANASAPGNPPSTLSACMITNKG